MNKLSRRQGTNSGDANISSGCKTEVEVRLNLEAVVDEKRS
jgi:hypothetical protein